MAREPGGLSADYGEIHHDASGLSVNYRAIAAAAANVCVANVKIKSPEDFGLLGLPTPRLDVLAKVDGSAVYGIYVRLLGMLYAAVRHAPVPGTEVRSLRFNAVCGMPGVVKAVRLQDAVAIVAEHYWSAKTALDALPVQWTASPDAKRY